jgi:hypothetical protein
VITGFDTVFATAEPPAVWLPRFLTRWQAAWPHLRVDRHDDGFVPWGESGEDFPSEHGEILVVRDADMESAWNEYGYDAPGDLEGPIGILYEPCPAASSASM